MIALKRLARDVRHPADLWLLLRIVSLSWILPLLLRWIEIRALLGVLSWPPERMRHPRVHVDRAGVERMVRWTASAVRHLPFSVDTCLIRCLILFRLFRSGGLPVRIAFGVRRQETQLLGHSWLEGEMDLPHSVRADGGFQAVYVYPEPQRGTSLHAVG